MTPTLYEWAEGTVAFRRLIDAFYDRVEGDDLLAPLFVEHAPVPRWGWGVAPPYQPS